MAKLVDVFLPLIHPRRFLEKSSWLAIGKAIHTETDGSEKGFADWIRFGVPAGIEDCSSALWGFRRESIDDQDPSLVR